MTKLPAKVRRVNGIDSPSFGRALKKDDGGYCSREAADDRSRPQPVGASVTKAEARVLRLVSQAKTNKEIGMALGISPATVKRHIEKILAKLGLRNRVEVAVYGLTLNGCPNWSSAGCALRQSEIVRERNLQLWAD